LCSDCSAALKGGADRKADFVVIWQAFWLPSLQDAGLVKKAEDTAEQT
jgi:hypothetical protein